MVVDVACKDKKAYQGLERCVFHTSCFTGQCRTQYLDQVCIVTNVARHSSSSRKASPKAYHPASSDGAKRNCANAMPMAERVTSRLCSSCRDGGGVVLVLAETSKACGA